MKRILLPVVFALTLTGGLALAQTPDPAPAPASQGHFHHKANPHREAMWMSKKLNLSADQTAKLEPILADRDQKMATLKSNTSLSPEDKKTQMRSIHQDTKQQLDAVLTPDQVQQMKSMRHRHGGAGQNPPAAPAPSGL
jgi:periplasmic protein CpxP/Spy